jgi:hypothetical protein
MIAMASLSYVDISTALFPNDLLKNESGLPSCISTAPMLLSQASASRTNGCEKFGKANTGAEQRAVLILTNAWSCVSDQQKESEKPSGQFLDLIVMSH